jgi:hypothetical protein
MRRSAAITVSAVIVLLGCGLALLSSFLVTLGFALMPAQNAGLQISKYAGLFIAIFILALAIWGIATGVNLLKLREWARISMIVFSVLALLIALPGMIFVLFVPFPIPAIPPNTPNPEVTQAAIAAMRPVMAVLYGTVVMLAGWWLYFFNTRPVKEQFRGTRNGFASAAPPVSPTAWTLPATASEPRKRPVSITIIAYVALISAVIFPVQLVTHFPMLFLGFFFTGWQASLISIGFMTVLLLIAHGLLRLLPWGRSLAIYYFNFAIFNSIISVILPGAQARYDDAVATMQTSMGVPASPMKFPIWYGLIFGLPIIAIQLWFLITSRKAFEGRNEAPRRLS